MAERHMACAGGVLHGCGHGPLGDAGQRHRDVIDAAVKRPFNCGWRSSC
jgi:hypothetical protein